MFKINFNLIIKALNDKDDTLMLTINIAIVFFRYLNFWDAVTLSACPVYS